MRQTKILLFIDAPSDRKHLGTIFKTKSRKVSASAWNPNEKLAFHLVGTIFKRFWEEQNSNQWCDINCEQFQRDSKSDQ
jgi:hypothetical protein